MSSRRRVPFGADLSNCATEARSRDLVNHSIVRGKYKMRDESGGLQFNGLAPLTPHQSLDSIPPTTTLAHLTMAYFQSTQHAIYHYGSVPTYVSHPQYNIDDEDIDWGNLILAIISTNERHAPPPPGFEPWPIPLRMPFDVVPEPMSVFSYGSQANFTAQANTTSDEAVGELVDWVAILGDLPPVPKLAPAVPTPTVSFGDGFAGTSATVLSQRAVADSKSLAAPLWYAQPPPMPAAPSAVRLGKRKREDRVSEIEEGNMAGTHCLARLSPALRLTALVLL